jgi:acetyl-CoA acetyltransferase
MMLSDHDWALTVLCEESRPDAAVTVSEWADEHRVLSSKASAEPGLWRTDRTPYSEFEVPYGAIGANYGYAMIAQRYMHEFGVKAEQLAKIAVAQRYNACHNPDAIFFGQPITVDDVLNSPVVVDPLHMLEIVMPVAGAAALVVTSSRTARRLKHDPVYILGVGEHTTHRSIIGASSRIARSKARRMRRSRWRECSGGTSTSPASTTLHDHVLVSLEDAGFAKKGRGGKFIDEHNLQFDGDFAEPAWRQLARQPACRRDAARTEAARQLGRAKGRQVKSRSSPLERQRWHHERAGLADPGRDRERGNHLASVADPTPATQLF